ncbi:MAG: permease-like cell division protein FtsX [Clostridia bacterium]|nr:permease-like cell division protein FtsX [Clostridia bacterium]
MRRYSLTYLLSRSFKGFSRNGLMSFASVLILTSCLLISGTFGLLVYNISKSLGNLNELKEFVCLCGYEKPAEGELEDIESRLRALPHVEDVKLTTREEALVNMKEKYAKHPQVLERFNEENNPFFEIFTVTYNGSEQDAADLWFTLTNEFPEFRAVEDKLETANKLEKVKTTVLWIFGGFMVTLVFISIIIIMNTVRMAISARSEEIEIMRYIGATGWFISFPFMVESLFTGLISIVIAFLLQFLSYDYLLKLLAPDPETSGIIQIAPFGEVWYYVLIGFCVLGFLTCYVGSKISLSKYIKV